MMREFGSNGTKLQETLQEIIDIKSHSPSILEGLKNLVSKYIDGHLLEPVRVEIANIIKDSTVQKDKYKLDWKRNDTELEKIDELIS